jgi:PIN domain nuclease of toxin-antitoxin system
MVLNCALEDWVRKAVAPLNEAPLTADIVLETGRISLPHADPADRFLIATARTLGLTLVTADRRIVAAKSVSVLRNA